MGRLDDKTVQTLTGRRLASGKGYNGLANLNVRFGSKADMCSAKTDACLTPESGHARRL